jgi:hypothetical protein
MSGLVDWIGRIQELLYVVIIVISTCTSFVCASYTCISCTCTLVCINFLVLLTDNVVYLMWMYELCVITLVL